MEVENIVPMKWSQRFRLAFNPLSYIKSLKYTSGINRYEILKVRRKKPRLLPAGGRVKGGDCLMSRLWLTTGIYHVVSSDLSSAAFYRPIWGAVRGRRAHTIFLEVILECPFHAFLKTVILSKGKPFSRQCAVSKKVLHPGLAGAPCSWTSHVHVFPVRPKTIDYAIRRKSARLL